MEIEFSGQQVSSDGRQWPVDHPIKKAVRVGDVVVVLYDPDALNRPLHHFFNVEGFDTEGRKLWTAEHPTTVSNDVYIVGSGLVRRR